MAARTTKRQHPPHGREQQWLQRVQQWLQPLQPLQPLHTSV
jgi:hypothetical protein